jgi:hypothetical protein
MRLKHAPTDTDLSWTLNVYKTQETQDTAVEQKGYLISGCSIIGIELAQKVQIEKFIIHKVLDIDL